MPLLAALFAAAVRRSSFTQPRFILRRGRCLHSAAEYPLTHPIYTVWAASTSLGKTLVSAGLSISFISSSPTPFPKRKFVYLKPVQTGFPDDSDSRFVYRKFCEYFTRKPLPFPVFASNCVVKASASAANAVPGNGAGAISEGFGGSGAVHFGSGLVDINRYEGRKLRGSESSDAELFPASVVVCKTMYAWKEAVSPHLAAEREEAMVEDSELLGMLKGCLGNGLVETSSDMDEPEAMCVIETAGGVASPGPSGSLQCDLYRPFRLPAILVGDGRLGGISGTISAYESLKLRGYDVVAVVLEDHGLMNEVQLTSYLRNRVPVLLLSSIPKDISDDLISWFEKSEAVFTYLKGIMVSSFLERTERLREMPKRACDIFWWPFTQHKLVPEEKVTVIDSRYGENFAVHQFQDTGLIAQQFDACASWWTQGPDANLQIELARDMGYTAARFGHVMFPENVHEPALDLANLLLEGVGKGWASRVYFSDNGSTAVEIALKMAFRKFISDHQVVFDSLSTDTNGTCMDLKVLALRGSYHGDTLGAMEAQAPSPYTGFLQQPWYRGKGYFLDPPTVCMFDGVWEVSPPDNMLINITGQECLSFKSRDEIFERSRDESSLAGLYADLILQDLQPLSDSNELSRIGALIIEPLIQGAGGMQMIDPLYQKILVKECKRRKIPVIFDEVFTGFWRLGSESAAKMLQCQPDIACFGKLLTGGIIPLAVTLASEAIFEVFAGDSKLKALLHGHSYTAHPMGCAAAVKSIKWFKDSKTNRNLIPESILLQELWDTELVLQVSLLPAVHRVLALGTVCAIELVAEGSNAGYASTYANPLLKKLHEDGILMRPLGNVIYLMCGPCTSPDTCHRLLEKVYARIQEFGQQKNKSAECSV